MAYVDKHSDAKAMLQRHYDKIKAAGKYEGAEAIERALCSMVRSAERARLLGRFARYAHVIRLVRVIDEILSPVDYLGKDRLYNNLYDDDICPFVQ